MAPALLSLRWGFYSEGPWPVQDGGPGCDKRRPQAPMPCHLGNTPPPSAIGQLNAACACGEFLGAGLCWPGACLVIWTSGVARDSWSYNYGTEPRAQHRKPHIPAAARYTRAPIRNSGSQTVLVRILVHYICICKQAGRAGLALGPSRGRLGAHVILLNQ